MPCVLQQWVTDLSFMQQSVLIASVRGPDGIRKDHVSKLLLRWLRRCIMISAFEKIEIYNPFFQYGGSFTGPSMRSDLQENATDQLNNAGTDCHWPDEMNKVVKQYLSTVDELPHHFQLHFMHASEILGYKHPNNLICLWWYHTYLSLVNDLHLKPEARHDMELRLGDVESDWRAREEITALGPTDTVKEVNTYQFPES